MFEFNAYDDLVGKHPYIADVMPENVYEHMRNTDGKTRRYLFDLWEGNIHANVKHNIKKHGWLNDGYAEIGKHKAVVAIGSGPSLQNNMEYLRMLTLADGTRKFEDQDFIFMSSNHQIKPCLEAGIIPHFAMVADASPDLAEQMDVGKAGKAITLIAAVTVHPDVIDAWPGPVKFVAQRNAEVTKAMTAVMDDDLPPMDRRVTEGGNILNLSFVLGVGLFRASIWMCTGNDLSYPIQKTVEDRRQSYYADGDYTTNIRSRRDEAAHQLSWAGFSFPQSNIFSPRNYVDLSLVYTSPQLFLYKVWLESNAMLLWNRGERFKIYNCSEGGILGVNPREGAQDMRQYKEKFKAENWCLMDETTGHRWRTRRLEQAAEEFHDAKERLLQWQNPMGLLIPLGARPAIN